MEKIYDYNLTKLIGKGAFGEVYLATKNNTNQYFAVKKIHEGLLEEKQRKYLRNEVQILEKLKKLKHPNIIIFYQTIKMKVIIILLLNILMEVHYLIVLKNIGKNIRDHFLRKLFNI